MAPAREETAGEETGGEETAREETGRPEMAPPRRIRLSAAQRRESILAAAVEVFSAAGFRAGKVSDVAALVGVSEPVIFQNFGSKAALFAAVVDRVAGDVQAELERLAEQPGSAAGLLAHALEPGHPHGAHGHPHGPGAAEAGLHTHGGAAEAGLHTHGGAAEAGLHTHGFGAHGVLFSDAFALIGEPELTEAARRAARTIADHLAGLIRRGQADGDIRADLDPGPAAWLLLSVLSTRAFRTAVAPDHDRVEDGVTGLALRLLTEEVRGS